MPGLGKVTREMLVGIGSAVSEARVVTVIVLVRTSHYGLVSRLARKDDGDSRQSCPVTTSDGIRSDCRLSYILFDNVRFD